MKKIFAVIFASAMLSSCGFNEIPNFEKDFAEMTTMEATTEITTESYDLDAKMLSNGNIEYKGESFSLTAPSMWQAIDQKPAYLYLVYFSEENTNREYADATINLMIGSTKNPVNTPEEMDILNKDTIDEFNELFKTHDVRDFKEEKAEINGHTGYFHTYTMYSEAMFQDIYYMQYFTAVGNKLYAISFTSLNKDFYDSYFENMKNIIATFKITE